MSQTYFEVFYSLFDGEELIAIEDPSLSVHSYQLWPIATSQYVGDNKEFDVSDIF